MLVAATKDEKIARANGDTSAREIESKKMPCHPFKLPQWSSE